MKKKIWTIVALTLLVIGCAPLQQAPLVYASKIAVGIDLSATSTESPGVSVSVGYKQVDAAYVPVAVAKKCDDKAPATSCIDPIYRLLPIQGSFGSNGTSISGPSEEEAKEALRKYNVEAAKLKALAEAAEAAKRRVAMLQSRKLELQARDNSVRTKEAGYQDLVDTIQALQQKDGATLKPEEVSALNEARQKKEAIDKERLQPTEVAELEGLSVAIKAATTDYESALAAAKLAEPEVEKLRPKADAARATLANAVARTDAYSVYGRFESSTRSNNSSNGISAGVELGKVFSTGVASQNLSTGLADYYRQLSLVACYDTVAKLNKTVADAALMKQMLAACAAQASK